MHRIAVIALVTLLLAPSAARAESITTLKLIIGGLSLLADFGGVTTTLSDIFGAGNVGSQSDDHPLYTSGANSPSLTISATEETFDLLLKQTNDVSEFEDDLPAVLQGTTQVMTKSGLTNAWEWKLTLEADVNSLSLPPNTELDAQGFVRHVFRPHPELNEQDGEALNYNMSVSRAATPGTFVATWTQGTLTDFDFDRHRHPLGPHMDDLTAELRADCCSRLLGDIDSFDVRLHAVHAPEPATLLLLGTGLLGTAMRARRRTRK